MAKDFDSMEDSNRSANPSIHEVSDPARRVFLLGEIFACPDGLTLDARGVLWIQTDMSSDEMHRGEMKRFGNNQMLACDPAQPRRYSNWPDFKPTGARARSPSRYAGRTAG